MKHVGLMAMVLCLFLGLSAAVYAEDGTVCAQIIEEATEKEGVKEISYDQFMAIRSSGEGYVLLDVLTPENYAEGHIEGAASFPVDTITEETALARLSKDVLIVVYCGSFMCKASTKAAQELSELGYNVLDYKGGLQEWQEKENLLVSEKNVMAFIE